MPTNKEAILSKTPLYRTRSKQGALSLLAILYLMALIGIKAFYASIAGTNSKFMKTVNASNTSCSARSESLQG
jgi:hypothetical protein